MAAPDDPFRSQQRARPPARWRSPPRTSNSLTTPRIGFPRIPGRDPERSFVTRAATTPFGILPVRPRPPLHWARHRPGRARTAAAAPSATPPAPPRTRSRTGSRAGAPHGRRHQTRPMLAGSSPAPGTIERRSVREAYRAITARASALSAAQSARAKGVGAETMNVSKPISGALSSARRWAPRGVLRRQPAVQQLVRLHVLAGQRPMRVVLFREEAAGAQHDAVEPVASARPAGRAARRRAW